MAQQKLKSGHFYYVRKTFDYFGVILLLSLLYCLWVLYKGPLSVPFLKPYIMQALNSENTEYSMSIGDVNLELIRSIQPVKIIAKDVNFRKNDDTFSVYTPSLSLSFSVRALLNGIIAPSSVSIHNPKVSIFTTYGLEAGKINELNKKKFELYVDWFEKFLERFNADEKIYPESYIQEIEIEDAEVEFHEVDLAHLWQFKDVDFSFERNFLNLELKAGGVLDLKDRLASLYISGIYKPSNNELALKTEFFDFLPADLIVSPENTSFRIDVPIDGSIVTLLDFNKVLAHRDNLIESLDGAIKSINFNIQGHAGEVVFNEEEKFNYAIDSFILDGTITGDMNKISIDKASFETAGQKMQLSLDVSGYQKYLFERAVDDLKVIFTTQIDAFELSDLSKFWPRYLAEPAWAWCRQNLFAGTATDGKFRFEFGPLENQKSFGLQKLEGSAYASDASISYLDGMPIVQNVYGTALFNESSIDIKVDKGVSEGIVLTGGNVLLYDLNKPKNYIKISLQGNSSITDALKFIDHPPLHFTKGMGLQPEQIKGDVEIDLGLDFELHDALSPDDVKVNVNANLKNVELLKAFKGHYLKAPQLQLTVDNKGFFVEGEAFVDDIAMALELDDNFEPRDYKSKALVKFRFDEEISKKLSLQTALLGAPYIEGYADIHAQIMVLNDKETQIEVEADLSQAAIDYAFLGFVKPKGESGQIFTKLLFRDEKLVDVPSFSLHKNEFDVSGRLKIDNQGRLKTIDVQKIEGPRTSAKAQIDVSYDDQDHKNLVQINVSGRSYDLSALFDKRDKKLLQPTQNDPAKSLPKDESEDVTDTDIFISVNKLWTNPKTSIRNVIASAVLKNGVGVDEVHAFGNYGTDKSIKLKLDYAPRPHGEHLLSIDSNNAGSTLRVLRLYDNMTGGILKINAKVDTHKDIIGHAQIRDFSIHNTPLLAKILSLASLSGMVDMLTGEGLSFSHFDAPFEYKNSTLFLKNANMFGNVLGITSRGTIARKTGMLQLEGIVSPAYSLNQFLGSIPLVGTVLAGKTGTIFAFNYGVEGNLEEPKITINPLSVLSPNSLKDLFMEQSGGFDVP